MELKGTITSEDYVAAQWLHVRPRGTYAVVGIALLVAAAWAIWYSFSVPSLRGNGWLLVGSLGLIVASGGWIRYKAIRVYRQHKALQRPIHLESTAVGLYGENETGHSTTPWTDYLRWKEGKTLFLLYVSDQMFHIIPKRFFNSESDITEFRNVLAANVRRR